MAVYLSMQRVRFSSPDGYEKFKIVFADVRKHLKEIPGFMHLTWWVHADAPTWFNEVSFWTSFESLRDWHMNTYHQHAKAWAVRTGAIMEDVITNFELKNTRLIRVCPCCAQAEESRERSRQLGVSRNTVVAAYGNLVHEGYLEALGRGRHQGGAADRRAAPARAGCAHATRREWQVSYRLGGSQARSRGAAYLVRSGAQPAAVRLSGRPARQPPVSARSLDQVRARSPVGIGTGPDRLCGPRGCTRIAIGHRAPGAHAPRRRLYQRSGDVTSGVQQGLDLACRLLLDRGAPVVIEDPAYASAFEAMCSHGAVVTRCSINAEGIAIGELPASGARMVYVTPSHQFPLGNTMSLKTRLALLEWARTTGTYIIEDDYDSDFRYRGAPLSALPAPLVTAARGLKDLADHGRSWLEQVSLADFINLGHYEHHVRKAKTAYQARCQLLVTGLTALVPASEVMGADGGMHLTWVLLADMPVADALQPRLSEAGVMVYTLRNGPPARSRRPAWRTASCCSGIRA